MGWSLLREREEKEVLFNGFKENSCGLRKAYVALFQLLIGLLYFPPILILLDFYFSYRIIISAP